MIVKEGRTLYHRDPNKNYQFVKIGEIAVWRRAVKLIRINGKLYTVTPAE